MAMQLRGLAEAGIRRRIVGLSAAAIVSDARRSKLAIGTASRDSRLEREGAERSAKPVPRIRL